MPLLATMLRLRRNAFTYIEQPFCSRYFVYFCLTNGTAGSADYTTTDVE
jgi:hypothetical protein